MFRNNHDDNGILLFPYLRNIINYLRFAKSALLYLFSLNKSNTTPMTVLFPIIECFVASNLLLTQCSFMNSRWHYRIANRILFIL